MKRIRGKIVLSLLLLIILSLFPLSVFAKTNVLNTQETVVLGKDEVINHDYFAAGNRVIINGTVNGDVYAAGGQIDVNGIINGDLLIAGGQITVRGKVVNNIRGAGGNIFVTGDVGRNLTLVGGNLTLDNNAKLGGNAVLAGGNIDVLSQVNDLTIGGGSVRIGNNVSGNVLAGVGTLDLAENAKLQGNLEYWSGMKARFEPGASVSGVLSFHETKEIERTKVSPQKITGIITGFGIALTIISFLSSLVLGILLLFLAPVYTEKTADIVSRKFWTSLLVGFVTLVMVPIFSIIIMITVIGIPVGFLILVVYGVAFYMSKLFIALAIGKYIKKVFNWKINIMWVFTLGLLAYYLVGIIPVIGWLAKTLVTLVGVGAIVLQGKNYFILLKDKKFL